MADELNVVGVEVTAEELETAVERSKIIPRTPLQRAGIVDIKTLDSGIYDIPKYEGGGINFVILQHIVAGTIYNLVQLNEGSILCLNKSGNYYQGFAIGGTRNNNRDIVLFSYSAQDHAPKVYTSADFVSGGGGTIDTAMSDSSENAVQNKVIKAYIDNAISGAIGGSY